MYRVLKRALSMLLIVVSLFGNLVLPVNVFAADSSISPSSASFNMASPQDINVTLSLNGNSFADVKNGGSSLVKDKDYSISGNIVTLKKSYFNYYFGTFTQNCSLVFVFTSGANSTFTVTPIYANSTISPTSISVNKSLAVDTAVYMNLYGNALSSITNGGTSLAAGTDYTVSGSTVTLKSTYLGNLAVGNSTLSFSFNRGSSTSLGVNVTDNATITPSTITFDKVNPQNQQVSLTLNGNTLLSIKNGSTVLDTSYYTVSGSVVTISSTYLQSLSPGNSTLTFVFSSGSNADLTVVVTGSGPADSTISPAATTYNTLSPGDMQVNLGLNGNTLLNIMNGTGNLISGKDYTVSTDGSTVTISKSYFTYYFSKFRQVLKLTFDFDNGKDPNLLVTPVYQDASLSPAAISVTTGAAVDTVINVTLNGNTLKSIKNGPASLIQGTDYTVSGSAVTIKATYLSSLPVGHTSLGFVFDFSNTQTLDVNVTSTGDSTISPAAVTYNTLSPSDMQTTLGLNGNTLLNIKNGTANLTSGKDYTVSTDGRIVTISKGYFTYYFSKFRQVLKLTFDFDNGKDPDLLVTPVYQDASLSPAAISVTTGAAVDTVINVTLNGNTLKSIKNGTTSLIQGTDYTVSGSAVTIKGNYLSNLSLGHTSLGFAFDFSNTQTLDVNVINADPTITPASIVVDMSNPVDAQISATLNGNSLVSIKSPLKTLVSGMDYSVSGSAITINKAFLASLTAGNTNLTFTFSNGKEQTLVVSVIAFDTINQDIKLSQDMTYNSLYMNGGKLDLNGHKITVNGKLVQKGGTIFINGGTLTVTGNYMLQTETVLNGQPSYGTSSGYLQMISSKDYVSIGGSFITQSSNSHDGYLTNGTMEIKGDFIQKNGSSANFKASGSHRVILNGNGIQNVTFEGADRTTFEGAYSTFNNLVINKFLDTGYVFSYKPVWNKLTDQTTEKARMGQSGTNPATGNYCKTYSDMSISAGGFDINFGRAYNSKNSDSTSLGKGWTFSYESSVKPDKNYSQILTAKLPDGSQQTYISKDGGYEAYDSRNKLVKNGDNTYTLTTKDQHVYGFNSDGFLVSIKDRHENSVSLEVYSDGRVYGLTDPAGRHFTVNYNGTLMSSVVDDVCGRKVQYQYVNGQLTYVIDPTGVVTKYEYDSNGLLNKISQGESAFLTDTNTFKAIELVAYASGGENSGKVDHVTDSFGDTRTYSYDNVNAVTTITESYTVNNIAVSTQSGYDGSNAVTSSMDGEGCTTVTEYFKDEFGRNRYMEPSASYDRNHNKTSYERDGNGNIIKVINPDLSFKIMTYDDKNNIKSVMDEKGRYTFYVYDADKKNLIKKVEPLNGTDIYTDGMSNVSKFAITTYEYYTETERQSLGYKIKDLLKSVTDPNNNKTTYTYNPDGTLLTEKAPADPGIPGSGTTRYHYNVLRLVDWKTSPKGYNASYNYDLDGRLEKTTLYDLSMNVVSVSRIVYDARGRKVQEITPRLYSATDDGLNDTVKTHTYKNADVGIRYTYYDNGKVWTVTDAENNRTTYTYDQHGNCATEEKPNPSLAFYAYDYDGIDRLTRTRVKQQKSYSDSYFVTLDTYQYDSALLVNGGINSLEQQIYGDKIYYAWCDGNCVYTGSSNLDRSNFVYAIHNTGASCYQVKFAVSGQREYLIMRKETIHIAKMNIDGSGWIDALLGNIASNKNDSISVQVTNDKVYFTCNACIYWTDNDSSNTISILGSKAIASIDGYNNDAYIYKLYNDKMYVTYSILHTIEALWYIDNYVNFASLNLDGSILNGPIGFHNSNTIYNWSSVTCEDVVGSKIYTAGITYDYNSGSDCEIFTLNFDGANWITTIRTNSKVDKKDLKFAICGNKIYYVWIQKEGDYYQIWTAECNIDGTGWVTTKRTETRYNKDNVNIAVQDGKIYVAYREERKGNNYGYGYALKTINWSVDNFWTNNPTTVNHIRYINDSTDTYNIANPNIIATSTTYDYAGRQTVQQNPDGTLTYAEYDVDGSLKSTTDANGNKTYYYSKNYDATSNTRYDETYVPTETVNGTIMYSYTRVDYDAGGRKIRERKGINETTLGSPASKYIDTTYAYYNNNKLKSVQDTTGKRTDYGYDEDGNLSRQDVYTGTNTYNRTTYENNCFGKPKTKKVTVRKGDLSDFDYSNDTYDITTSYEYYADGSLNKETAQKTASASVTTTYDYDNMGRLKSTTQPGVDENSETKDIVTSATYDWEGRPLNVVDAKGNSTVYGYDYRGFLKTVTNTLMTKDPQNPIQKAISSYDYDRTGRKIKEVTPLNNSTANYISYTYDKMGRLKTKVNHFKEYKFDLPNNVVNEKNATITQKAYQYDNNGNVVKELDALGFNSATGGDDSQIATGYGTEYTYDMQNRLVQVLDPESKKTGLDYSEKYSYDALGRKISEAKVKGTSITDKYTSNTTYDYDDSNNKLTVSVDSVKVKESTFDLAGNLITDTQHYKPGDTGVSTTYTYNALGKQRSINLPGDDSVTSAAITCQYEMTGSLAKKTNNMGTTIAGNQLVNIYTYDNQGHVTSQKMQKGDGSGAITVSSIKYDLNGNKRFEKDGNQYETEYTYDELNRLTSTIKRNISTASGNTSTHSEIFIYDLDGNLKEKDEKIDSGTNSVTNAWKYNYDSADRLYEKFVPGLPQFTQFIEYNANSVTAKVYDAFDLAQSNPQLKYVATSYEYDRNNRLTATINPRQYKTSQTYDLAGNIATKTDGRGNKTSTPDPLYTTTYKYDKFDRLVQVINAKQESTSYEYDLAGNMISQTDGRLNKTIYDYNVQGKISKRVDPGGRPAGTTGNNDYPSKTIKYKYNPDGTLLMVTDRKGNTVSYQYNAQGLVVLKTISGMGNVVYDYDGNGNLLTITDSSGTITRTYDNLNRVTTKNVKLGTTDFGTFKYDYDILITQGTDANFTAETDWYEKTAGAKTNKVTKVNDRQGRLKYVIDGDLSSTTKTTYNYYDNGSRQSIVYPDGSTNNQNSSKETYVYYEDGRLKTLNNYKSGSATAFETYGYTYDEAGNMTGKDDAKGHTGYIYDNLNRIETVNEPGVSTTWHYDAAGNRDKETVTAGTSVRTTKYTYNEQNRLTDVEVKQDGVVIDKIVYTNDYNGNVNVVTDTPYVNGSAQVAKVTTNIYDTLNQLISTSVGSTQIVNEYNAEGLRVGKTVNGTKTRYFYEYDKVILETDAAGNQTGRNIYGTNLISRTVDGTTLYYLYNGHADVTALVGVNGVIRATYYYDAFGNVKEEKYYDASGNVQAAPINNSIGFAGYQYDKETGMYYLNARMYDPKIARFMQEDTVTGDPNDPLSLNLYTYCHNEPLMYSDPTGHKEGDWWDPRTWASGVKQAGSTVASDFETGWDSITSDHLKEDVTTIETYSDSKIIRDMATGYKSLILSTPEEREKDFETIDKYGGLNPVQKSLLALDINAVDLGNGMVKTFVKPVIDDIKYAQESIKIAAGGNDYDEYYRSQAVVRENMNMIGNIIPNTFNGLKDSAFDLYKNGSSYFDPNATLSQRVHVTEDATNLYFGAKMAKGFWESGVSGGVSGVRQFKVQMEAFVENTGRYQPQAVGGYANISGWKNIKSAIGNSMRDGLNSAAQNASGSISYSEIMKDSTSGAGKVGNKGGSKGLPDDTIVVRGGESKAGDLIKNQAKGGDGTLSANGGTGLTEAELSKGLPQNKISTTTAGELRAKGYDVISSPTANNPNHVSIVTPGGKVLTDAEAANLQSTFTIKPNPSK